MSSFGQTCRAEGTLTREQAVAAAFHGRELRWEQETGKGICSVVFKLLSSPRKSFPTEDS